MSTSFEQFRACLTRPIARSALGLEISDREAERINADESLARAYYDNWLRTPRPPVDSGSAKAPAAEPAPASFAYAGAPAVAQGRKVRPFTVILWALAVIVAIVVIVNVVAQSSNASNESPPVSTSTPTVEPSATPKPAPAKPKPKTPVVSAAERQDEAARDAGWEVAESGELYVKAGDPGSFTCGYYTCLWYNIQSMSGCPNGVYLRADILSNGTPVGWTNAISPSIRPGEVVGVMLEDVRGLGDGFRPSEANCY